MSSTDTLNAAHKSFALDIAREAGSIIKANFTLGMEKVWKADHSPLTASDLAINDLVMKGVQSRFPGYGLLSEEGSMSIEHSEFIWVCDPLDGTIPFSHGIPTCVFSLALVHNGDSVLGVVYDPFLDRMYFAAKGEGAFLNNRKINVSSINDLEHSAIGVGYWREATYDISGFFNVLKQHGVKTIDTCSIIYLGALVANGELVATIFPGITAFDTASLKILVEEAGGKVTDLFGNEQRYDQDTKGHLVTNGVLHENLAKLIKQIVLPV